MRKQIDNILLGTLWSLAVMLGASFWFSIIFRFNIFMRSHWQYLGRLQASGAAINPYIYISIGIIMLVGLFGMYMIIMPKFRKINFTKNKESRIVVSELDSVIPVEIDALNPGTIEQNNYINNLSRPPRLDIPIVMRNISAVQNIDNPITTPLTPVIPEKSYDDNSKNVQDLFKSSGYVIKNIKDVFDVSLCLFAIAPNETVWIGAQNEEELKLEEFLKELETIFLDTLPGVTININSFILNPTSEESSGIYKIERFDNLSNLGDYLINNPAPVTEPQDKNNYENYSEYIDAAIKYIENLNT